jgi:putative oxidoreductase
MVEFSGFLQAQGLPVPLFAAVLSAYAQFLGSLCVIFGYKIRLASFVLVINFVVATIVHLRLNDTIEAMTPPLAMLFGCLTFIFTGAGKYAISTNYVRLNSSASALR